MLLAAKRSRADIITEHRQKKPLSELLRKARKAKRRGLWTQEELDFGKANGIMLADFFKV